MFENQESLLNAGAIFSGCGVQVRSSFRDFRIGVLQMLHPPTEEKPDSFILDFAWLAMHQPPEGRYFDGERGKEIKVPIQNLQYEIRGHIVILNSGNLMIVLFTRKSNFYPKESLVSSWLD